MKKTVAWGILGLGKIAHKFAQDLALVNTASLVAVASSSQKRANDFAQQCKAQKAYGNYKDLYDDPVVEVIYIAGVHKHCLQLLGIIR